MKTHDEGQVGKQITGSRHPVTDRTSKYLLRSAWAERKRKAYAVSKAASPKKGRRYIEKNPEVNYLRI